MRRSWASAAMSTVLVVVSILGTSIARSQNDAPTVFVTLNIPNDDREAEILTLRLNVRESHTPCGHGNLTINDQDLAQDGNGNGHGTLAVNGYGNLNAEWAFSPGNGDEKSVLLKLQITELNGLEIAPFNFSTSFTQVTPRIHTITGAAVVNRIYKLPQDTDTVAQSLERLHSQIHDLDILRIKANQLKNATFTKEKKIVELLGQKRITQSKNIQGCVGLECIFNIIGWKFSRMCDGTRPQVWSYANWISRKRSYGRRRRGL